MKKLQYLGTAPELADPARSKVIILPLPLEKSTSYGKGAENGPSAIVTASHQVEFFDPEFRCEPCKVGIHTDWTLGDPSWNARPVEENLEKIRNRVRYWLDREKFVLSLGGEHTITVGTIDPFIEKYKGKFTIVQIDAHADLKDQYENSPYSHACVMRRILGRVPIVSAGIRSVDDEEFAIGERREGIRLFYAHEIRKNPNWIQELVAEIKTPYVYLTVDVDGLDPSIFPATGTPEPGGISWWQMMDLMRELRLRHEIVGADVNELAPGSGHHADFAAAKLVYKIIGYSFVNLSAGRGIQK